MRPRLQSALYPNAVFTNPRPNVIESDEGFTVSFPNRTSLEYAEADARWHVSVEFLAGQAGLHVYSDTLRPTEPTIRPPLDAGARARIIDNVRRALRSQGVETRVT